MLLYRAFETTECVYFVFVATDSKVFSIQGSGCVCRLLWACANSGVRAPTQTLKSLTAVLRDRLPFDHNCLKP
jgi:hypothetical protein